MANNIVLDNAALDVALYAFNDVHADERHKSTRAAVSAAVEAYLAHVRKSEIYAGIDKAGGLRRTPTFSSGGI